MTVQECLADATAFLQPDGRWTVQFGGGALSIYDREAPHAIGAIEETRAYAEPILRGFLKAVNADPDPETR